MRIGRPFLLFASLFLGILIYEENLFSEKSPVAAQEPSTAATPTAPTFRAFTGKITRNKVRMRLQASLDSPVVRELNKGDMIVVVGETEDYYAVQPPADIRGFIYRTLVLDNVIEGNHVNVRLEPSLDAPVLAQLNQGDQVTGQISAANSKWMEIEPPKDTRFFVSRDFIEKIGNAQLLARLQRRQKEVNERLAQGEAQLREEQDRPYEQSQFEALAKHFQQIIEDYTDFPEQVVAAKEQLTQAQEAYLKKKALYLEQENIQLVQSRDAQLKEALASKEQRLQELEAQISSSAAILPFEEPNQPSRKVLPAKLAAWIPAEDYVYQNWCRQKGPCSKEQFYSAQRAEAVVLAGVVEPYTRAVKNKPGDYLLLNAQRLPIAYLYSTQINLQDYVGQEVQLLVARRPNNQFAFPAYYVLEIN